MTKFQEKKKKSKKEIEKCYPEKGLYTTDYTSTKAADELSFREK